MGIQDKIKTIQQAIDELNKELANLRDVARGERGTFPKLARMD